MDSILNSVKKMLGITEEDTSFDDDIIMHINSAFMIVHQLGAGPENGFSISDEEATWDEYFGDEDPIESIRSYVYLKVRSIFDPPTTGAVKEAVNNNIHELEFRINVAAARG